MLQRYSLSLSLAPSQVHLNICRVRNRVLHIANKYLHNEECCECFTIVVVGVIVVEKLNECRSRFEEALFPEI